MGRIRTIKPEFFKHSGLFDAELETGLPLRLAYAGLWTCCDREGRFKWRARELKLDILPYDDCDPEAVLEALAASGFIRRYDVDGHSFGYVIEFHKHQCVNQREAQSVLPDPEDPNAHVHAYALLEYGKPSRRIPDDIRDTVMARDPACVRCGSTDDPTVDHIFPFSMGGTLALTNLRRMCRSCNSARPTSGQALIEDLLKDGLTFEDMDRICMHVQVVESHVGKGREGKGTGKEGKGKRKTRNAKTVKSQFSTPEWVPVTPWEAFVEMRKDTKHPLTPKALSLAVADLERLRDAGNDPAEVLNQSTMRGWRGLFEVKNGGRNGNHQRNGESVLDLIQREQAEAEAARTGDPDAPGDARADKERDPGEVVGAAATELLDW